MPFTKIYIHAVWGTKHRFPLMDTPGRNMLCKHIVENARKWNIIVLDINGQSDHLHALLKIGSTMSIAQLVKMIKGESSAWANNRRLFEKRLYWARGYYARSVDENNLPIVCSYITHQNTILAYQHEITTFLNYYPVEEIQ